MSQAPARARLSWPREVMSSLVKTMPKWYWTVRGFRNSQEAIFRVGQATGGQPGDLCLLCGQLYRSGDGGLAGSPAGGPKLAAGPADVCFHADVLQHLDGGAQLLAAVGAEEKPPPVRHEFL